MTGPFCISGSRLATSVSQPAAIRFPERVHASDELLSVIEAAKLRKLHAAIVESAKTGRTLTIRVEPRNGRVAELFGALEVEIR